MEFDEKKFKEDLEKLLSNSDEMQLNKDDELLIDWIRLCATDLQIGALHALEKFPQHLRTDIRSFSALLTAIARFTSTTIAQIEAGGFFSEGLDLFHIYKDGILPNIYVDVKARLAEEEQANATNHPTDENLN